MLTSPLDWVVVHQYLVIIPGTPQVGMMPVPLVGDDHFTINDVDTYRVSTAFQVPPDVFSEQWHFLLLVVLLSD